MMRTFEWPTEDGWPYPDVEGEVVDLDATIDDDAVTVHAIPDHVLATLSDLERTVLGARFGLAGAPEESMRSLHNRLGVPRRDLADALGSGLDKLRAQLA